MTSLQNSPNPRVYEEQNDWITIKLWSRKCGDNYNSKIPFMLSIRKKSSEHLLLEGAWVCVHSVMSDSLQSHGPYPTRLLCPWDFLGKNTGAGCHFLLQGIFPSQGSNPHLLCPLHWQADLYHCATREEGTLCGFALWAPELVTCKVSFGSSQKKSAEPSNFPGFCIPPILAVSSKHGSVNTILGVSYLFFLKVKQLND